MGSGPRTGQSRWLAVLAALALSACGRPVYDSLVDEDHADDLGPLKQRFTAAARTQQLYPTTILGRPRVSIESTGDPAAGRTFVMIHGAFADSRCWRFLGGNLLAAGSLTLVDLPGCGRSDKPSPDEGDYSVHGMATAAAEALTQHLSRSPAEHVTLVGHSLGGSIIIEMLGHPSLRARFAPLLELVDSVVLIAPVDRATELPLPAISPKVRSAVETSGTVIDLADLVGVLRERVSDGSIEAVHDRRHALREEADERVAMLTDPAQRDAMKAMLLAVLPPRRGEGGISPDWEWIAREREKQRSIETPTLILWGERDESTPPTMGYRLAATIPRASLVIIDRTMHSPYIERPEEVGTAIRRFVDDLQPKTPVPAAQP